MINRIGKLTPFLLQSSLGIWSDGFNNNQLSESIHTWTIGSLHSMTSDPRVHAGGGGGGGAGDRDQNLVHLLKLGFLC